MSSKVLKTGQNCESITCVRQNIATGFCPQKIYIVLSTNIARTIKQKTKKNNYGYQ
jgi:hypothetical protein